MAPLSTVARSRLAALATALMLALAFGGSLAVDDASAQRKDHCVGYCDEWGCYPPPDDCL
jgi:hypothetical protein